MKGPILIIIACVLFLAFLFLDDRRKKPKEKSYAEKLKDTLIIVWEVFYRNGYYDFKENKPHSTFDVNSLAKNKEERIILSFMNESYDHGWNDAKSNLSDKATFMANSRKEMLDILGKLKVNIEQMKINLEGFLKSLS